MKKQLAGVALVLAAVSFGEYTACGSMYACSIHRS